jgi:hypothetical protein
MLFCHIIGRAKGKKKKERKTRKRERRRKMTKKKTQASRCNHPTFWETYRPPAQNMKKFGAIEMSHKTHGSMLTLR